MMLPTAPAVYLALFMEDTLIYTVVKYDCHVVGKLQHSLLQHFGVDTGT
jgi:hypothetical protein